ncbi:urease accessory protein UreD [Effusibacillus consociatus]|uniref:Urease accessory protein UreD n=1 Tax=Effusibacillus consociatus TaxID=1117041 RepID=A0ABV9PX05_9BACL
MRVHGVWKGTVGVREGRSALLHSFHQSPLKVAKPFAGERGELLLYLMDSSPGLFNGDTQEIECTLEKGASLYLTNQSSCKLHPSLEMGETSQIQRFNVRKGALLEYFPEALVPYHGANYFGETVLEMQGGAQAIVGEIITPGRAGRGELFQYEKIASQFSVSWEGQLAVWDSLLLEPARWNTSRGIFDGYTHIGTLWVLSEQITHDHVKMLETFLDSHQKEELYAGTSLLARNGLVMRMLGPSVWRLQSLMHECWDLIRRELLGKPAPQIRK